MKKFNVIAITIKIKSDYSFQFGVLKSQFPLTQSVCVCHDIYDLRCSSRLGLSARVCVCNVKYGHVHGGFFLSTQSRGSNKLTRVSVTRHIIIVLIHIKMCFHPKATPFRKKILYSLRVYVCGCVCVSVLLTLRSIHYVLQMYKALNGRNTLRTVLVIARCGVRQPKAAVD